MKEPFFMLLVQPPVNAAEPPVNAAEPPVNTSEKLMASAAAQEAH
jgi:hypothetical protein